MHRPERAIRGHGVRQPFSVTPAPHYRCITNENSTAMNEMMQETVAERYRIVLTRFDCLWNQSVPASEAEASSLLTEILQLELALSLNESAGAFAECVSTYME